MAGTLKIQIGGVRGAAGADGNNGSDGENAWEPVFAIHVHTDAKRYLKVTDWTGGEGTKPAVNVYIGASGFETEIANAVAISEGGVGSNVQLVSGSVTAENGRCYIFRNSTNGVLTLPPTNTIGPEGLNIEIISDDANLDLVIPSGYSYYSGWLPPKSLDATHNYFTHGGVGVQQAVPKTINIGKSIVRVRVSNFMNGFFDTYIY